MTGHCDVTKGSVEGISPARFPSNYRTYEFT
jgi:hypothetical protein